MLRIPVMIVNFKTYENAVGENGLELARKIEKAALESGKEVAIAVEAEDIRMISSQVKIPVLAQHVDIEGFGAHTGSLIPEAVKEAGVIGTLINHTERELSDEVIEKTVVHCKKIGLITVICANTTEDAVRLSKYEPDFIAVEPPELIGGDVSVSSAQPDVITKSVEGVEQPVLCGAGIHTKQDVEKAIELGSKGILLASGIVKAENPYKKTKELLEGLN